MRYNICILVLLLFVLSGCEKEINLEHMRPEPKLVLNCLAVQGDTLSVELSRTWFYADNKVKDIFCVWCGCKTLCERCVPGIIVRSGRKV